MFWNDDDEIPSLPEPDVQDVVFIMSGKTLPNDALSAIALSLSEKVPDWSEFQNIGLHLKLGGEEGNGWYRDSDPNSVLYLSRRSKLVLRTEQSRLDDIQALSGLQLNVGGHGVKLIHKHNKKLEFSATLYSQYIIFDFEEEIEFLAYIQQQLKNMGINCQKILCGKSREITIGNKKILTRSLMLNDLTKEDSLSLQAKGLGDAQKFGCGVFVPYKSIS